MKYLITVILSITFFSTIIFAAVPVNSISPGADYLRVETFLKMTPAQFEKASGHHLNFFQKLYFKKLQRKLSRSDYKSNDTIDQYYDQQKNKFKFDPMWFVLRCFIGPFAILFSYTSKQSKSKRLSALIGTGLFIIWFGLIFLF